MSQERTLVYLATSTWANSSVSLPRTYVPVAEPLCTLSKAVQLAVFGLVFAPDQGFDRLLLSWCAAFLGEAGAALGDDRGEFHGASRRAAHR